MRRGQILSLFRELRSKCPRSNSECATFTLRRTGKEGTSDEEEFELELEWVPDEPARIFLKDYASKHHLAVKATDKVVQIYGLENKAAHEENVPKEILAPLPITL